MKIQRVFSTAILFMAFQLTAWYAPAPANMPIVAIATVRGYTQGQFKGNSIIAGLKAADGAGLFALVDVEYKETGNGKSQLIIKKYPDASSGQFQTAFSNNEKLGMWVGMVKFNQKGDAHIYQTYLFDFFSTGIIKSITFDNSMEKITIEFPKLAQINFPN